jgi:outer membrane protein OmpA-like peptidoglycan-associated protein/tetratricopeptide (TPR) repeat protein
MNRLFTIPLCLFLLLTTGLAVAQRATPADTLMQQADRMLSYKAYGRAIDLYTQLLSTPQLTPEQRTTVHAGMGQAYRAVGDNTKAEVAFREWQATVPAGQEKPAILHAYAQTLTSNGKFAEGQAQFDKYQLIRERQRFRLPSSIPTLAHGSPATKREVVKYQLEDLDLNTPNEEFSPMFYRDGLVYVAGKRGDAAIETSGKGGGTGYLDLIYVPNRGMVSARRRFDAEGQPIKEATSTTGAKSAWSTLGNDYYTRPTANDSRTSVGFDAGINVAQGLGYSRDAIDPARQFAQSINTRYHEGPATFSADGTRIIFTRNNFNNGKAKTGSDNVNRLKLYTAQQVNGAWGEVTELPFNSDEYSVGHPALCKGPDGTPDQLLYFASDLPGGYGATDIYVSQWQNGKWGEPVNLGPGINTKGNELFPFADENGNLYFSTDGRRGLGALDIFYAAMDGTNVLAVETIDAPINSNGDDFGIITDGNRRAGYFSSSRGGSDDIFRFVRQSSLFSCRDLTIRVYAPSTDAPIDSAMVLAKGNRTGQTDQMLMVDKNGFVRICLEAESDYTFTASRDGYVNATVGFSTKNLTDDQPSRLELAMMKPTVIIDTVYTAAEAPEVKTLPGTLPNRPLTQSRIRGVVLGEGNGAPIEGVTVKLKNECNGQIMSTETKADGSYEFDIMEGCDYTLIASKPSYGTSTSRVARVAKKSKPKELTATFKMLREGDVVPLDNIYYDMGNAAIRQDAARELEKMVATMQRYPTLVIEIRSHTDSRGDAGVNKALSARRARAVADYLASKGISRSRLRAIGMGEGMLINNCTDGVICTEAEHQRNRRTEFKVLAIK